MPDCDLDNESWGSYDGQCQACDDYGLVNDVLLCRDCAGKLERDLIRQRDWDYTFSGYALPQEARGKLREEIIKQYGKGLELIANGDPSSRSRRRRRKKKNHKRRNGTGPHR